jgi:hypothetical protein
MIKQSERESSLRVLYGGGKQLGIGELNGVLG